MKKVITIKNEIGEIEKLAPFIEEIGEELHLDLSLQMSLNMVLEEAVSNVILYAYPKEMSEIIDIQATSNDNLLIFTITDSGVEFDPTQTKDADITLSLEERPIGGLGIFIIKKIMNEVTYQRIEGNNVLTLKKYIDS